ncbi:DUF3180 domain-containing protein [Gardnerella vaginalis]|uniref:DUF3180 domain-containing protein n=1 Tax=Gardnerella vaginalis TaxID=2702 RepID=UPI0039EEE106
MKAYRTPWWYLVIGILFGFVLGAFLVSSTESSAMSLAGAPWVVVAIMVIAGLATFVMAWQTHQSVSDKNKNKKRLNPQFAVAALMLSKSLGMAGAILSGWYVGQLLMSLPHSEIILYSSVVRECSIAGLVCFVDMILGIIGELLCQIPPEDGAEAANKSNRTAATC